MNVIGILFQFLPLLLILWLASLADRSWRDRAPSPEPLPDLGAAPASALDGIAPAAAARPAPGDAGTVFAAALPGLATGLWIPSLFGMLLLLRPVRRLVARLIPIDPRRTVHAVSLSFTMLVLINMLVTIPLLPALANTLEQQSQQGQSPFGIGAVWAQEIGLLIMALIGTGLLSRRTFAQVLDRLGFVRPSGRQVAIGVVAGLLLIPVSLGLQALAGVFHISVNADVERLSNALVGPLTQSAFGIITMGVAAGLGEEAVFRGALQPRFGLVLATLLFALLHGQDGLSLATLVVLIIGFALAVIRQRTNTTTSLITHAVYNSTLGLLAFLQIMK